MSAPIVNARIEVIRRAGHSLELGVTVQYLLKGLPFSVIANRDGVQLQAKLPFTNEHGITLIAKVIQRAVVHHKHLATFAIGEKQTILDEPIVEAEVEGSSTAAGVTIN